MDILLQNLPNDVSIEKIKAAVESAIDDAGNISICVLDTAACSPCQPCSPVNDEQGGSRTDDQGSSSNDDHNGAAKVVKDPYKYFGFSIYRSKEDARLWHKRIIEQDRKWDDSKHPLDERSFTHLLNDAVEIGKLKLCGRTGIIEYTSEDSDENPDAHDWKENPERGGYKAGSYEADAIEMIKRYEGKGLYCEIEFVYRFQFLRAKKARWLCRRYSAY